MLKEADKFVDSSILEGMVSLRSVISARESGTNDRKIEKVLFDSAKAESKSRELSYIRRKGVQHGFNVELTDSETIENAAVGSTHGGIIAYCGDRTFRTLTDKSDIKPDGFYVMLEGIEDPYNFGYALRSIYAAGADGIILTPRNWMSAAGVVCRASAGASELFEMHISESTEAAEIFRHNGYKVVCADIKNSVSVYAADLKKPVFLIVGGEKRGISRAALDTADIIVRLDYGREFPAALSAASAASIIAYEVFRQNI